MQWILIVAGIFLYFKLFRKAEPKDFMLQAIDKNDLHSVQFLIEGKVELYEDLHEYLWYAMKNKKIDIVAYFFENFKFDIDKWDYYTPLIYASKEGSLELVQCLIKIGADVNAWNTYDEPEYTALTVAIEHDHFEIVKYLIEQGADVNKETSYYPSEAYENDLDDLDDWELQYTDSPLIYACTIGNLETVKYLIEKGASLVQSDKQTALSVATENNHNDVVEYLLSFRTQYDIDQYEETFKIASSKGNTKIIQLLVQQKLVTIDKKIGEETLLIAIREGNFNVVIQLIEYGVDPNTRDNHGTPLTVLAYTRGKNISIVTYLVNNGADINGQDKNGNTLLLHAVDGRLTKEGLECFVKLGASVNISNNKKETALSLAKKQKHYINESRYLVKFSSNK